MEQKMYKQMASGRKPPGVIARLMGLDALPAQCLNPIPPRVALEGCKQGSQQKNHVYQERTKLQCVQSHADEERKYKDVYEVQNQASRTTYFKDESRSAGRFHDQPSEKKTSLVQNKFLEARCLAKYQNLHQSKDFWDAIKVLNSDTDAFLEFLQETNLLSDYLPNMTNCITVLKPTMTLDALNEKHFKKESTLSEAKVCSRNRSTETMSSNPASLSHPTRIVVLKPSPSKSNLKELISSPALQKRSPNTEYPFEELGNYETSGTREMAKKITQQMRESFGRSNRKDESLPFSSLSNGYTGDDSSFRTEYMYMEEEFSNSSYPPVVTPSHHLWDYAHRVTSSYSSSSCSRASISPESLVIREAKKRLSDRLAMVATDGAIQEQRKVKRSSSTLGEMLAISEATNERKTYEEFIPNNHSLVEVQCTGGESSLSSSKNQVINLEEMPHRSLQKSLYLPSSPAVYENIKRNLEVQKEIPKTKGLKLSIRGKVSGFFSRNKKHTQVKILEPALSDTLDNNSYGNPTSNCKVLLDHISDYLTEEGPNHIFDESQSKSKCASTDNSCLKKEPQFSKESLFLVKPDFSGNPNRNTEQPSPVSVLEVPLEEDTSSCSSQSHDCAILECHKAISKSLPLIESVARSLFWDDDACTNNDLEAHIPAFNSIEKERMNYVKSLLSLSGFDNLTIISSLTNCYSQLSPLNPSLLEKFLDHKGEDAKCREKRSRQRLLFDCVNHALMEIIHIDVSNACRYQPTNTSFIAINENPNDTLVTDKVIERVNSWFSTDDSSTWPELGDNTGMLVHIFLTKEVCGREWEEMIYLEVMDIEKEIEKCMMEELVTEVLDGFIVFR